PYSETLVQIHRQLSAKGQGAVILLPKCRPATPGQKQPSESIRHCVAASRERTELQLVGQTHGLVRAPSTRTHFEPFRGPFMSTTHVVVAAALLGHASPGTCTGRLLAGSYFWVVTCIYERHVGEPDYVLFGSRRNL